MSIRAGSGLKMPTRFCSRTSPYQLTGYWDVANLSGWLGGLTEPLWHMKHWVRVSGGMNLGKISNKPFIVAERRRSLPRRSSVKIG
jgi:hypothetical protein